MLNVIVLQCRIVTDLKVIDKGNGAAILNFTVACDRYANGQKTTDFFPAVAWHANAFFIGRNFKKGSRLIINGRLQSREYETESHEKRKVYEIAVNSVEYDDVKKTDTAAESSETQPEPPPRSLADKLRDAAIKPQPKIQNVTGFLQSLESKEEKTAEPFTEDEPRGELPFEI